MASRYAVPADRVASRTLDGEAVVINLDSGAYFGLNPPATTLWNLLEAGPRSDEALALGLAAAHGADPEEVAADVGHFLGDMERAGLLVRSDAEELTVGPLPDGPVYVAPVAERYETLDDLMLSGE
jgi:hypothetical protein